MTSGVEAVRTRILTQLAAVFKKELPPALNSRLKVHLPFIAFHETGLRQQLVPLIADSILGDARLRGMLGASELLNLLKQHVTEEIVTGAVAGNLIQHLGLDSAYKAIVREGLELLDRAESAARENERLTSELAIARGNIEKDRALAAAQHSVYKLSANYRTAVACVQEGLGYDTARVYIYNRNAGTWHQKFQAGEEIESRAGNRPVVIRRPGAKEEKLHLEDIIAGRISGNQINNEADLYTWQANDKWALLHIPQRQGCYFVDQDRFAVDQETYQEKANEMLFLVIGNLKEDEELMIIQMTNWRTGNPLLKDKEGDLVRLRSFAEAMTTAIENRKLHELARTLSAIDPLTGLYNRRRFAIETIKKLNTAARAKKALVLSMGDIDHFKLKNDTHGHIFGDRILARVGAELRKTRGDDVAGRYGGEEFAIITMLSNGNENDANVVTRGIAEKVAALEFRSIEGQAVPVTMSIGFTIITPQEAESLLSDGTLNAMLRQLEQPDKIESLDGYISEVFEKLTFMGRADKALYFAKQNGRQKVVGFVPGVPDSFEVTFDLKKA